MSQRYGLECFGGVIQSGRRALGSLSTCSSELSLAVMMILDTLRSFASDLLFNVFGFVLPALNSIKAVQCDDIDGIKEYSTYWVVLSISYYIGQFLNTFNYYNQFTNPEAKVLFVLWLTLPQFQGAYRIYTLFLCSFYNHYEQDIDNQIASTYMSVRNRFWKQLKTTVYVLLFSSNDNLLDLAITMKGLGGSGTQVEAEEENVRYKIQTKIKYQGGDDDSDDDIALLMGTLWQKMVNGATSSKNN